MHQRNVAVRGVEAAARDAGLGKVTPHDLRRSLCSLSGRRGVDPVEAAQITGHSLAVWTRHYARSFGEGSARRGARSPAQPRFRRAVASVIIRCSGCCSWRQSPAAGNDPCLARPRGRPRWLAPLRWRIRGCAQVRAREVDLRSRRRGIPRRRYTGLVLAGKHRHLGNGDDGERNRRKRGVGRATSLG
jgi:hypothetical protein